MYEINYIKITFNNILSSDLAKRKKFNWTNLFRFPPNNIVWQLYYNKQTSVFFCNLHISAFIWFELTLILLYNCMTMQKSINT